ncbi:hypothetical protein ACRAKI_09250 [Saccharothrix isguenensis]
MLTTTTCVTADCDTCGEKYRDEEWETTVHFTTESEAMTWLAKRGWHVTDDGRALSCDRCVAEQLCTAHGHVFDVWHDCRCKPGLSGHDHDLTGTCRRQFAWCDRCEHREYRVRGGVTLTDRVVA